MKRLLLFSVFYIIGLLVFANMSSPYISGTSTSEAYSSRDIDVISEQIEITLLKTGYAKFNIVYEIRSDRRGVQIPLIFDTMSERYSSDKEIFKVFVNGQEVKVYSVPSTYENPDALRWIDSIDSYLNYPRKEIPDLIGLKYFEVDIPEGINTIRVEYLAEASHYLGSPVTKYSYSYNLEPARYWRSFGNLYIKVDATEITADIETDLGDTKDFNGLKEWNFTELPQDTFNLSYIPEISKFASILIAINGAGLALIFTLIFVFLHIYWVLDYRKKNPDKRFSLAVIAGSILVPFIYCVLYMVFPDFIDSVIGDHASRRHGYLFFIFFMYPFFLMFYLLVMWLIDYWKKNRLKQVK